jgi:hypothetical protein
VQRLRGGPCALRLMRNPAAGSVGAARSRSFHFFIFLDGCRVRDALRWFEKPARVDGAGGVAWESRKDRTAPVG